MLARGRLGELVTTDIPHGRLAKLFQALLGINLRQEVSESNQVGVNPQKRAVASEVVVTPVLRYFTTPELRQLGWHYSARSKSHPKQ